jgi:hypothetical protein
MSGMTWTYGDSGVAVGSHTYTARVEATSGKGSYSSGFGFNEISPAPAETV